MTPCPACGAGSSTDDYCDQCGAALSVTPPPEAVSAPPPAAAPPPPVPADPCPNCGAARTADDAFCEGCGLDFATGQLPAVAPPPAAAGPAGAPSGWTAVVEADRAFFDGNVADAGAALRFPDGLAPRPVSLHGDEVVIGRRSEAKGFFPGIDLSTPVADAAVSQRHAALRRQADGSWAVIDEMSTNGTYLNGSHEPLEHGVLTALHEGDRLNLGAFTRITIVKDAP